jgi:hypothetical protein
MQPSEFEKLRANPESIFSRSDIADLTKISQELQRLLALLKNQVFPKLRILGLSRGQNPDITYGRHIASKLPEKIDPKIAQKDYLESWQGLKAEFGKLNKDLLNKLTYVPLDRSSPLADNLGNFIKNINNKPDIGRAYTNTVELASNLDLAIRRLEIIIQKLI